jgi:hypothetical protein
MRAKSRRSFLYSRPLPSPSRTLRVEPLEQRAVFNLDPAANLGLDLVHPVFAPGTAPEVIAAYDDIDHRGSAEFDAFNFSDSSRWSRTATSGSTLAQGDATVITWSIAPDGTPIPGYNGEPSAPNNLRGYLASIYGTSATSNRAQDQPWFSVVEHVFHRWSAVSGVTYVYEPADDGATIGSAASGARGVRGDVRLSGHYIDGPSSILAYNFFPTVGDMILDTGDSFFRTTSGNSLRLRNTIAHEAGHGLGLGHVEPTNGTKLMEPMITLGFDGPQADDILAVNRGYGDRLEKNGGNDTPATATNLGSLSGAFFVQTVSIDDNSDTDWFRFTVGGPSALDLTLTPTGSTYMSNGKTYNSLAQSNLVLAVFDGTGSTLIAGANRAGLGQSETVADVLLPGSGVYLVRVKGWADAAQMYRLAGSVTPTGAPTPAPEIQVLDGAADIADNTGSVNLGSVTVGGTITRTITIRNAGSQNLTLGSAINLPAGYSLAQPWSATTLVPGGTTTFTLVVNTASAGTLAGTVSLATNDADENPFNFAVIAAVTAAPSPPSAGSGLPFADNFNRTNSTLLGTGWTERRGDLGISSGTLRTSTAAISMATVNGVSQADVVLSANMNLGIGSTTRSLGLVARQNGNWDGNWYLANLRLSGGQYRVELWKQVAGMQTLLASAFVGSGAGQMRFEVVGSSLKAFWKGTLVASANDSQLASGRIGVRSNYAAGLRLDNFSATLSSGASTAVAPNSVTTLRGRGAEEAPPIHVRRIWQAMQDDVERAELRGRLLSLIAAELNRGTSR